MSPTICSKSLLTWTVLLGNCIFYTVSYFPSSPMKKMVSAGMEGGGKRSEVRLIGDSVVRYICTVCGGSIVLCMCVYE